MKNRDIKALGDQRAYATFEIENVKEAGSSGKRTFTGIASTIQPDLMDDVVVPNGAEFTLPLPLIWGHDASQPIGWVRAARIKKDRIEVDCEVHDEKEPGKLKDRLDECWQQMRAQLVRGLSIGFRAIDAEQIDGSWGIKFLRWRWLELSPVVIPANQASGVLSLNQIKSADEAARRALQGAHGARPGIRSDAGKSGSPDASGTKHPAAGGFSFSRFKGTNVKTLQEMIEARNTKSARMNELVELRKAEGRAFTADEGDEFDALDGEVASLDDDIRIKRFEERQASAASRVKGNTSDEGRASRGGMSFVKKADPDDKFKGQSFIRTVIAKAASAAELRKGNFVTPADIAMQRWGKTHPNLVNVIKAGVAGGGTGSGEWGAELAQSDARFSGDFIEFLYGMTIFDRLPLREVPARVHIKGQDGAATGYWTGESKGIAVSKPDFSDVELTPLKVGAIAVCSKELVLDSSPSAEMWIRDSLAQASAQRVDTTFLGTAAASNGVSPAGLLNGLSAGAPSGTDAAAVRADLMTLYTGFLTAKNASGLVQIMTPSMAKALALLVNALGQPEFVGLNADGGTLLGDRVFTGDNVTGGHWILLKPSDIWKIGDSGIDVSMTDVATIEQDSAPAGAGDTPTAASATLMSLWQTEQVGFKVVRRINYAKRRSTAVAYMDNCEYGGVVS
ncbi:MAG: phage major capsid protein [Rhodocyclaceae bacterium]